MHKYELCAPNTRRELELIIVGFNVFEQYHEFGVDSEFIPIDDIDMWTHEFSEMTVHQLTKGGLFPISISIFPNQIPFRIHHLMVSLHTPSIIRIEDENGKTLTRKVLFPDEFDHMIKWKNTEE